MSRLLQAGEHVKCSSTRSSKQQSMWDLVVCVGVGVDKDMGMGLSAVL